MKPKSKKPHKKRNTNYLLKAYYASPKDTLSRIPELEPLTGKVVAAFGLGCLGAPSVLELTRAGVKEIRIVDSDVVDPATTVRWPFGFIATGHKKVDILKQFINENYPYTKCESYNFRVGGVRENFDEDKSDQEILRNIFKGADLVYDSTAELGVQYFLSEIASGFQIPYIGLAGTYGAWGGNVFRIKPSKESGCFCCYLKSREEGEIPEPPSANEDRGMIQPVGCADPTFTGAGFDMLQIAIMGVKMAVSTLCEESFGAYPRIDWDVVHIRMRSAEGALITPSFNTYTNSKNPRCNRCGNGNAK